MSIRILLTMYDGTILHGRLMISCSIRHGARTYRTNFPPGGGFGYTTTVEKKDNAAASAVHQATYPLLGLHFRTVFQRAFPRTQFSTNDCKPCEGEIHPTKICHVFARTQTHARKALQCTTWITRGSTFTSRSLQGGEFLSRHWFRFLLCFSLRAVKNS